MSRIGLTGYPLGQRIMHSRSRTVWPSRIRLDCLGNRVDPGTPVFAAQQLVRFIVADHFLCLRIPGQCAPQFHRDVREDAARGGDVALLDVRHGLAA